MLLRLSAAVGSENGERLEVWADLQRLYGPLSESVQVDIYSRMCLECADGGLPMPEAQIVPMAEGDVFRGLWGGTDDIAP